MSILEIKRLRDSKSHLACAFLYWEGSWGLGGIIQRHKDTCESIIGKRTLNGGYTVAGSTWDGWETDTPSPFTTAHGSLHCYHDSKGS